ncbi:MAG: transglycosylase domain-containing protein [Eubacteriales bacterium]|nr:transglycosylase domain-containing protein [Eubacteriales bacterium]
MKGYSRKKIKKKSFHIFRKFLKVVITLFLLCLFLCFGAFKAILDSTPPISSITLGPSEFATKIYDKDGNTITSLVQEGSNREKASFQEIPTQLINAFVSIEDERFWSHYGVDPRSIFRAILGILSGDSSRGGGSTITQQLVKNAVFDGARDEKGFEKYVRKFQEWYIAIKYEKQTGKTHEEIKQNIITEYLNTINLGSNTLGVKVAARRYFDKDLKDLTISECAVIAGITKNPSRYNPINHQDKNAERRQQILYNMKEQSYINEAEYNDALNDDVYNRITDVNTKIQEQSSAYSYFVDALLEDVVKVLKQTYNYSDQLAKNLLYSGGLSIYTTQDSQIQKIVDNEINNEEYYDTKKYSLEWRYTIKHSDNSISNYNEIDIEKYIKDSLKEKFDGLFKEKEDADEYIDKFKKSILLESDTELGEVKNFSLEPQVSFVLIDQHNGEVLALNGGRGTKNQSRTLNRAVSTKRQPGSTFKVISTFAPALEECQKTLATTYYDAEYSVRNKTFKNWYSSGYLGLQNIRAGIIYSLNIIAAKCMVDTVTPEVGVEFAKKMGISTLSKNDYNPATALGGLTDGVTNLELTNSFACIANAGTYNTPKLFTKILDKDGNVLIDNTNIQSKVVMSEENAFLLTDAMKDSMQFKRAYAGTLTVSSTSTRANFSGMTVAGKSGTTTSNNDVWFVGYTPYYTAGVWAGCDENQSLSDSKNNVYNGGTNFHKDIWKTIMEKIHDGKTNPGFVKPKNIITKTICQKSGLLPTAGCLLDERGNPTYSEYFIKGTEPKKYCTIHSATGRMLLTDEKFLNLVTDDVYYMQDLNELIIPNLTTESIEIPNNNISQDDALIVPNDKLSISPPPSSNGSVASPR